VTFVGWEDGVYPIAVSSHTMLVTALSPQSGSSFLKPLPSFNFETKAPTHIPRSHIPFAFLRSTFLCSVQTQPFLHSVVAYLLQSDNCSLYQVDAIDDDDGHPPVDFPKEIAESSDDDDDDDDDDGNDDDKEHDGVDAGDVAGNGNDVAVKANGSSNNINGSGKAATMKRSRSRMRHGTEDRMEHAKKYYALYTLSRPYDRLPHYKHSLELLLHQALQVSPHATPQHTHTPTHDARAHAHAHAHAHAPSCLLIAGRRRRKSGSRLRRNVGAG
jgi:hypothetical protein